VSAGTMQTFRERALSATCYKASTAPHCERTDGTLVCRYTP
jgi:hypothetical protein